MESKKEAAECCVRCGEASGAAAENPTEEVTKSTPKRYPGDPPKFEMEAHNLIHVNCRAWCAICNRAALKDDPHYKQIKYDINRGHLCISFDCKTMGESDEEEHKVTCIVPMT